MISKSSFVLGVQCEKSYWFKHNRYPETNPSDDAAKERLSAGQEVGEISKMLFPDGEEIPPSLPPAYAIPDSPGFNLLENNAIPNINPKCLNCVFNKENHCTKWNATIRSY